MGSGIGGIATKTAALGSFDGTTVSESLFIVPASAITGISASLAATTTPAGDVFASVRLSLQVFTGATWTGSAWSGGSWSTFWSTTLGIANNATNTAGAGCDITFDPPRPIPIQSSKLMPAGHANAGMMVPPNTHAATEVAGEYDVRAVFTLMAGAVAGISADLNVTTV